MQYIRLVSSGEGYNEKEILSNTDKCNDYILTRLRTKWGINLSDLNFISDPEKDQIKLQLNRFKNKNLIAEKNGLSFNRFGKIPRGWHCSRFIYLNHASQITRILIRNKRIKKGNTNKIPAGLIRLPLSPALSCTQL